MDDAPLTAPGSALYGVVPNFSEGRRAGVIVAIVEALHVPGARVVYAEADPAHNRLDTTVLGSREAVAASAMAGARVAVDLIDLNLHTGGHPRMGAADVIPFMPVRDVAMEACVELARAFGARLAEALDLPVYLYDRAALDPSRASLADVRRGEFEGLRAAVAMGERLPDFGPHALGRAGATAVGARKPLIAFNVYLDGTDEAAAKRIASSVRESGGGLPAVRAIGFAVPERDGIVTVSMNLVDHDVTGLREAYDEVARRAATEGMVITDSEIVGLVPASAVAEGDAEALNLRRFDPARQVLERLVDAAGREG
jgi:glutamate formiminotransferase